MRLASNGQPAWQHAGFFYHFSFQDICSTIESTRDCRGYHSWDKVTLSAKALISEMKCFLDEAGLSRACREKSQWNREDPPASDSDVTRRNHSGYLIFHYFYISMNATPAPEERDHKS